MQRLSNTEHVLIGSFDNAARTKDLSRFECMFWNTKETLIVLARSLYLFGCVVYVALLLRMANDVEENPGPTLYDIVDPCKTVCADFSQSNARTFGRNACKQCVAMSLTAIVQTQVKNMTTWDSSFLNKILCIRNYLYRVSQTKRNPHKLNNYVFASLKLKSRYYLL